MTATRFLLVPALALAAFGQTYTVETIAGSGNTGVLGGGFSGDGGPATAAQLRSPQGVAVGRGGLLGIYVADTGNGRVRRIKLDNTIETIPGGTFVAAPRGLIVDKDGLVAVMDEGRNQIIGILSSGQVGSIAGQGASSGTPANMAYIFIRDIPGIALASDGLLFGEASKITKITLPDGRLEVLLGSGGAIDYDPESPYGIAADVLRGDLFFTSPFFNWLVKVSAAGTVTSLIPRIDNPDWTLNAPRGVAVDAEGNVFVASSGEHKIIRVTPEGAVSVIAGTGVAGFSGDGGPANNAQFSSPSGLAVDAAGNIYVADTGNHRVRALLRAQQAPAIGSVVDGASFLAGAISPGKIVTIFGTNLGPLTASGAQVVSGELTKNLANVRVLFDGVPAPMIAASSGQVNAIVPYTVGGKTSTLVVVENQGHTSPPMSVAVQPSAPSLFTADASGNGQGAFLNEDQTPNRINSPAARGSTVVLFATGEGLTIPPGVDGKLTVVPYPSPLLPVSVQIGGIDAKVVYKGGAPGLTAGLLQVNVIVPKNLANTPGVGQFSVTLKVGDNTSQPGVTLAVKN